MMKTNNVLFLLRRTRLSRSTVHELFEWDGRGISPRLVKYFHIIIIIISSSSSSSSSSAGPYGRAV